jgi:hypothetical protein
VGEPNDSLKEYEEKTIEKAVGKAGAAYSREKVMPACLFWMRIRAVRF